MYSPLTHLMVHFMFVLNHKLETTKIVSHNDYLHVFDASPIGKVRVTLSRPFQSVIWLVYYIGHVSEQNRVSQRRERSLVLPEKHEIAKSGDLKPEL